MDFGVRLGQLCDFAVSLETEERRLPMKPIGTVRRPMEMTFLGGFIFMGRFVGPKATSEKDRARPPKPPPATSPSTAPFKRRGRKDGGIATSRDGDARPRRRRVRRRGHLDVLLVEIFLGNTQKLGARDCSRRHRRAGVRGRRRDRHLGIGVGIFRGNVGRVAVDVGPV